jgi:hypothetical protein
MTLDEVRAARDVLEGELRGKLREFETATGCDVVRIQVVRHILQPGTKSMPEVMLDFDLGRPEVVR